MNDDGVDADRFQEDDILGKVALRLGIAHRVAAIFYDEGFAGIALEIGQRLDERFGLGEEVRHLGGVSHRRHPGLFASSLRPMATTAITSSGTITAERTTLAIIWPSIRSAIGRTP